MKPSSSFGGQPSPVGQQPSQKVSSNPNFKSGSPGNGSAGQKPELGSPAPVRFRRVKAWIGRLILAVCASGEKGCLDTSCRLKPFCKCAREDIRTLGVVESRVWILVFVCGLAAILYWLFWAPRP
jgi:hypothetical protein